MKTFFLFIIFAVIANAKEIGLEEQESLINELEELKSAYNMVEDPATQKESKANLVKDSVSSKQAAPKRSSRKPVNLEKIFERIKQEKKLDPNQKTIDQ